MWVSEKVIVSMTKINRFSCKRVFLVFVICCLSFFLPEMCMLHLKMEQFTSNKNKRQASVGPDRNKESAILMWLISHQHSSDEMQYLCFRKLGAFKQINVLLQVSHEFYFFSYWYTSLSSASFYFSQQLYLDKSCSTSLEKEFEILRWPGVKA